MKEKILNVEQVLTVIEGLCHTSESENIEVNPEIFSKDAIQFGKFLNMIYQIAHSHNFNTGCYGSHADWRKRAKDLHKELKEQRMI